MSKAKQIDDLTPDEIKDVEEFYKSKDRKTSSIKEFLEELHNSLKTGFLTDDLHFQSSLVILIPRRKKE